MSDIPCGGIGVKEMDAESQRSVNDLDSASWRRRIYSFVWYSICQSIDNTQNARGSSRLLQRMAEEDLFICLAEEDLFIWRRIYSLFGGGGFIHLEEDLFICLAEEDLFIWRRIYSFVWLGRIYSFEGGFIHLSGGGGFIHLSGTPATTTKQSGSVTYLTRLRHCGIVVHFPNPLSLPSPLARRSQQRRFTHKTVTLDPISLSISQGGRRWV